MELSNFKDIVTRYKAVFFDAYGVLKNHKGILPGIAQTFDFLEDQGIDYYIVTNDASRSRNRLPMHTRFKDLHISTPTRSSLQNAGTRLAETEGQKRQVAYLAPGALHTISRE